MTTHTLKIMTYNIHKGFASPKTRFVLPQIRDALRLVDADMLFMQEVVGEQRRHAKVVKNWPKQPQHTYLAHGNWQHHVYGKNAVYRQGHHGNAILSKYPFQAWENINITRFRLASRSLLHAEIKLPHIELPVHIICVHFGLFRQERVNQFRALGKRIEEFVPDEAPLIIAGDFNDWRKHKEAQLQKELGLQEVFHVLTNSYAKSYPARRATLKTDRIYYRGLQPTHCMCLNGPIWRKLSDHLPLYAEFKL